MTASTRIMSVWNRFWRVFVALFGLDRCPTPPPHLTARQRATRQRLEQRLRGPDAGDDR